MRAATLRGSTSLRRPALRYILNVFQPLSGMFPLQYPSDRELRETRSRHGPDRRGLPVHRSHRRLVR